ncbi:dsDNA nuclease domain-containing protein [Variovorax sp. Root434]|uniref:dsDNA nuclease domain-containing protein n=1 Tax=Variovorax sp. Root434 TaxID=1736536 RepID=UPI0006F456FD|nr:dsDNA nuclease domain-containing protein [Variovorax sp. Root434]KQX22138.1 hypothetical protein ASD05_14395 [Variovorax sp. Root434]
MTNARADTEPSLNDVLSLFKDYSGDETGGIHAVRGFSFQIWLAVLEVLKAHATGEDYAVVLEWQQDIAVLNSSSQPSNVRFIQVKKNESSHRWTLHGLLAATAAEETLVKDTAVTNKTISGSALPTAVKTKVKKAVPSTLAKLYFHRRRFSALAQPASLVFASNAPFYVGIGDDDKDETVDEVELDELTPEAVTKVESALRKQLEIPTDEVVNLEDFILRITNCPPDEGHKFVIGELVELCQNDKMGLEVKAPFVAVCLVASYVKQRAGKGSYSKDFAKLLSRAVTRTDVTHYFAAANDAHVRPQALVEQIIARLNAELADFEMVKTMQLATSSACAEVTNRAGVVWPSAEALVQLAASTDNYKARGHIKDRLPAWLADFRALNIQDARLFNDGFLYCLMAMILNDAQPLRHLSASATGPQPEAEE